MPFPMTDGTRGAGRSGIQEVERQTTRQRFVADEETRDNRLRKFALDGERPITEGAQGCTRPATGRYGYRDRGTGDDSGARCNPVAVASSRMLYKEQAIAPWRADMNHAGSRTPVSVVEAEPGPTGDGDNLSRFVDRPEYAARNRPTSRRIHLARFSRDRAAGRAVNGRTPADDDTRMRDVPGGNAVFAP